MKIAIITCYKDPDYVRARVLRAGLASDRRVEPVVIKNRLKNPLRYFEVLGKLVRVRFRERPDAYLVTFRGYEILPFVLLLAGRRPVVFDEFINLIEWVVYEHQKLKARTWPATTLASWYRRALRRCTFILADTRAHAAYSSALSGVSHSLYRTIPVGTDERLFRPAEAAKRTKGFEVFYYGNMLPLHGLDVVLAAILELKDEADLHFTIIGGDKRVVRQIKSAQDQGLPLTYKRWLAFKRLPAMMQRASLCLAGPFGNTEQSRLVITGKTYQMLACAAPTLIGRSNASAVFTDRKDCLLVPQGDASALAKQIIWAKQHPAQLKRIGLNGRKLYERQFSQDAINAKLRRLIDELAALS